MSSHVNRVTWLVELVVGCDVLVHLARTVFVVEAVQTRRTLAVDDVLMVTLGLVVRVAEDLAALSLLRALRLREALVQHVLIVLDEGSVAAELVVESVLRVGEDIALVGQGGGVRGAAVRLRHLVVLAQVRVEGALTMGRSVVSAKSARRVADVGVATASIIHIDDRL